MNLIFMIFKSLIYEKEINFKIIIYLLLKIINNGSLFEVKLEADPKTRVEMITDIASLYKSSLD